MANNDKLASRDIKKIQPGLRYYSNLGATNGTIYECIYVNKQLAVFIFRYQGMDRTHTIYFREMKHTDWTPVEEKKVG